MLRVGTILRGIYRIDSYLSSGGFGNTYVATNIEFDERVAVKEFFIKGVTQRDGNQTTVSVSNAENQDSFLEQREKFKKEARRLRQLDNPHIVKVHDLFEENGTAYYVMDYVDGENLSDRLKRTGQPMTEAEVNEILPQILEALKSVHDTGIWHLDLKPANIMVDKSGQAKLIDFGASKQLNAQKGGATTSTAISYTNGYAPREQMEQNYDKFGPWTDLYALGATLYNLLTAKRPPLPSDIDDDMSEDKHLALPMPNVSDAMRQLALWLMKTNRLQRPKSIEELTSKLPSIWYEQPNSELKAKYSDEATKIESISEETIIETPKKEQAPINGDNSISDNKTEDNTSTKSESNNNKYLGGIIISIVAILFFILLIPKGEKYPIDNIDIENRITYESLIGSCQYVGPVDKNNRPDGNGEAFFDDGRYYRGYFEHGVLSGDNCYFKYANGDVFEGKFRDNAFYYGKYTIAQDKSYFIGYYENGQPAGGTWYDENGKVIE